MRQKNVVAIIFICALFYLFFLSNFSSAQGTWIRKADFGGVKRCLAVGFSIGTKGYIGTGGDDNNIPHKDFWEWDQANDLWTQKADFGGTARGGAVGFSIGTKGYIGTGANSNDFWEWDQGTNAWSQKADFGGVVRIFASGFSIGTKGYIGTGIDFASGTICYDDFWEWDQATNSWTQKANFAGAARRAAIGFSIGTKGYIGTGVSGTPPSAVTYYKDFWEWNQVSNSWTQKADFGGTPGSEDAGFSIGQKGYVCTSDSVFWQWNQATNMWTQKANFGGVQKGGAVGFSIGTKGYIGTGNSGDITIGYLQDFWEYIPDSLNGVNELGHAINISVFPNPTAGKIEVNSSHRINSIEVYNVQGEKVYSTAQIVDGIDLSTRQAGVYFMRIKTEEGVAAKKIFVQR